MQKGFEIVWVCLAFFSIYSRLDASPCCCCGDLPKRFESASAQGMRWVPGGEFTMGADYSGCKRDERPAHLVRVDGFWMDETPVTNRQFKEFVDATESL